MAKWIRVKKRVLELREWVNLDHAMAITLHTTREAFQVRFPDQEITISKQDDPEAFQKIQMALVDSPPPFVGGDSSALR